MSGLEEDTMQDNDRTVSVSEAAAALGVSTDAIRKRLTRGTIAGEKVDGQWRVILPDNELDTQPDNGAPPSDTPTGHGAPGDMQDLRDTIEDLRGRLDRSEALVSTLVTDLRNERERADTLQALRERAQDRIRELEALQPGDAPENEVVESPASSATDATGISTHVEPDHTPDGRWSRFLAWLRGE